MRGSVAPTDRGTGHSDGRQTPCSPPAGPKVEPPRSAARGRRCRGSNHWAVRGGRPLRGGMPPQIQQLPWREVMHRRPAFRNSSVVWRKPAARRGHGCHSNDQRRSWKRSPIDQLSKSICCLCHCQTPLIHGDKLGRRAEYANTFRQRARSEFPASSPGSGNNPQPAYSSLP